MLEFFQQYIIPMHSNYRYWYLSITPVHAVTIDYTIALSQHYQLFLIDTKFGVNYCTLDTIGIIACTYQTRMSSLVKFLPDL